MSKFLAGAGEPSTIPPVGKTLYSEVIYVSDKVQANKMLTDVHRG